MNTEEEKKETAPVHESPIPPERRNRQLTIDSRKAIQAFHLKKIDAIYKGLEKAKEKHGENSEEYKAFKDLAISADLSIRLVHNTNWINERIVQWLKSFRLQLETAKGLKADVLKEKIKRLEKQEKCRKAPCYGRGFTGYNKEEAEFIPCACSLKNADIFLSL